MSTLTIGEWLDGPPSRESRPAATPPQPRPHDFTDSASSAVAIGLCLTTPVAISMTPRQIEVLQTLCRLQQEEAGLHSLLPDVMEVLLELARKPWWSAQLTGIQFETAPPQT